MKWAVRESCKRCSFWGIFTILLILIFGCSDNDKMKFVLALGDSYTIGESVNQDERWPVQLTETLRLKGIKIADPEIVARTGWTTDELDAGIRAYNFERPGYDLVSLQIGVNNQYRGRDTDNFRLELRSLIETAIGLAKGNRRSVLIISIPDWGTTPFAADRDRVKIAAEIDLFNSINREESLRYGVRYIDITEISRKALSDPLLIANDGLHPSGSMYSLWIEEIAPAAYEILKK